MVLERSSNVMATMSEIKETERLYYLLGTFGLKFLFVAFTTKKNIQPSLFAMSSTEIVHSFISFFKAIICWSDHKSNIIRIIETLYT